MTSWHRKDAQCPFWISLSLLLYPPFSVWDNVCEALHKDCVAPHLMSSPMLCPQLCISLHIAFSPISRLDIFFLKKAPFKLNLKFVNAFFCFPHSEWKPLCTEILLTLFCLSFTGLQHFKEKGNFVFIFAFTTSNPMLSVWLIIKYAC